ncbi:DUF58 domain-containing protein [Mesoterricola sediminis]|uniref:DUF58 domain-containing protein n=1 Tax=Mesoterricola sediminis TaxID=2927980 RepID=UPI001FB020D9|nr:DUF58 domain-containing protein [Mesoterricola sediminis]
MALLALGAAAVNTGNNLLYLVFSLMLGLFLASGWISRRAIRDLEVLGVEEGNLFARVKGAVKVRYRDGDPARLRALEVRLDLAGARAEAAFVRGGDGTREGVAAVQVTPAQRGWTPLRNVELRTAFPFGFMEKAWSVPLDQRILVLPHPRTLAGGPGGLGDAPFPLARAGAASPDGARPFRERDPLSRVHWKRTAQRGEPWVRTFEDEAARGVRLVLDLAAWEPGPAFERELEGLSGSVLQARLQRRQVRLEAAGSDGRVAVDGPGPCWRALALAQAGGLVRDLCSGPDFA